MDRWLTEAWAREATRRLIISIGLSVAFHMALFAFILGIPWLAALLNSTAVTLRLNGHQASMGNFVSAAASRGSKGDDESGIITLVRTRPEQPEPVTEPAAAPPIEARKLPRTAIRPAEYIETRPAAGSPDRTTIRAYQNSRDESGEFKTVQPARRPEALPWPLRERSPPATFRRTPAPAMTAEAASPPATPESGLASPTRDQVASAPSKLGRETPSQTTTEAIRLAQATTQPAAESPASQAEAVLTAIARETPEHRAQAPLRPDPTAVPGVPVRSIRSTPRLGSRGSTPDVAGMGGSDDPPIPRIVYSPATYPPQARRLRLQGETRLEVDLTDEGRVAAARLETSSGHTILDEAALREVRAWRFRIPKAEGVIVPMTVIVYIGYHL